ncbi:membrane protein [Tamlana nanhaiensis]|uniref:Membrane protein n=1 Tax=Neotamlana nanhaiensis TaxID=1382798 RepID=A0A0D7W7Z5_9FLAO|nr:membrane protein [Tamlana nanhaiensis]
MNDFLFDNYNYLTFFVESLAAFTGILLYKRYSLIKEYKWFIWFLIYLTICDSAGKYVYLIYGGVLSFLEDTKFVYNYWWSTLFWKIGAVIFFVFYYVEVLNSTLFKKVLKFSGITFLCFSLIYIVLNWEEYFVRSFPVISVLGALIIFMCTIFYFIEVLSSNSILTFYKSLNFYVSTAIFIWWLIITPLVFYDLYHFNGDWNFIFLKWQIYLFANLCMYFTFTFALIYCKPEETKVLE